MTTPQGPWLALYQVAEMFAVEPKTVTRWVKSGKFDRITIQRTPGGHRKFLEADILEYQAELTRQRTR